MKSKERFIRACENLDLDRPPVWLMRQAGRALPEYNALREKHSFWEICTTPDLAAEVSLQPIKRFDLDASIIFSDILVVPAAMGMNVDFTKDISLSPPIRTKEDLNKLKIPDVGSALKYVADAIKNVYTEVGEDLAVLGFSGAPYTLACYMIEGGGAKTWHNVKALMLGQPRLFQDLMDKITETVADYLDMQTECSVTAVQVFDTWAVELAPVDFERFVLPYVSKIIERLKPKRVPVIYYINGIGNLLEQAQESGADVIGIDWRIRLADARERLGPGQALQGNLDPAVLLAPAAVIREKTFEMLDQTCGRGHIVNLGHGLLPQTPIEGIETFIKSVAEWAENND